MPELESKTQPVTLARQTPDLYDNFLPLCMDKSIWLSRVGGFLVILLLKYEIVDSINNANTEDTPELGNTGDDN